MINTDNVKSFWETRGKKWQHIPFESIANLEENPALLELKVTLEQDKIMPLLSLSKEQDVLDLGAGVGQWSFRLATKVKEVTAVEYMSSFTEIGEKEADERGIKNVKFITSPAEEFLTDNKFDLIFISGLFVFLNPQQAQKLVSNLPKMLKSGGRLFVRDGTSILENHYKIDNRYSEILNEYYSAYYRTRDEYVKMFEKPGFKLINDGQIFDEGCPLNKFTETRLRYYLFDLPSA